MNLVLFLVCLVVGILVGVLGAVAPGAGAVLGLLQRMLFWGVWLNLLLAFFNLIPVPPLDGSHLLYHLLPAAWAARYRYVARYGVLALIVVILVMPQVFWVLLTPAFALQGIACDFAAPFALEPLPLCTS